MKTAKEKIKEVLEREYVSSTEEKIEMVAEKIVKALGLSGARYISLDEIKSDGGRFTPEEK